MIERKIEIINKLGLHARAASVFVKTASAFGSEINVSNDIKSANGKSIMSMMMLQAACGSQVIVKIEGEDEDEAMQAILEIIEDRFGESE